MSKILSGAQTDEMFDAYDKMNRPMNDGELVDKWLGYHANMGSYEPWLEAFLQSVLMKQIKDRGLEQMLQEQYPEYWI